MKDVEFRVDIPPAGKGRPRFMRNGHTYTPDKTREAEKIIRLAYQDVQGECFEEDIPVTVEIFAYFPIPKSYSASRKFECIERVRQPLKKPDADNIAKLVLDALNGVAYKDDAQVTRLTVNKDYAPSVYTAGFMIVRIRERK